MGIRPNGVEKSADLGDRPLARILREKRGVRALETDAVFKVLDGHDFHFDGDPCRVEVYGVYDQGDQRWVQLALDGDRQQMLTLRLDVSPGPKCALVSQADKQLMN